MVDTIDLNKEEIILLAENSFKCSFLSDKEKKYIKIWLKNLNNFLYSYFK